MNKRKYQKWLWIGVGVFALCIVFIACHFRSIPWQFYSPQSIGPNNAVQIHDTLAFTDELVIFNSQDNSTYALQQESGALAWQFTAQNYSPFPPTITHDRVYLANFDGTLYALDLKKGYEIWRYSLPEHISPDTPVSVSADGQILFVGTRGGELYALNAASGQLLWKKQFAAPDSSDLFAEGTIHFGTIYTDEQSVYAFNAQEQAVISLRQSDGQEQWRVSSMAFTFTRPSFTSDFIVFYQSARLVAIHTDSGQQTIISRQSGVTDPWNFMPLHIEENSIVVIDGQELSKIDLQTGQKLWSIDGVAVGWDERTNRKNVRGFSLHDGLVFAQRFDNLTNRNTLVAIDFASGQTRWEAPLSSNILVAELRYGDEIIFGEKTGSILALNLHTGAVSWHTKLNGEVLRLSQHQNNILAITADNSDKNNFYLLSGQKKGNIIWKYTPDSIVDQSNVYISPAGTFFLDEQRHLLEKIPVGRANPEQHPLIHLNFSSTQKTDSHDPYLEHELKESWEWRLKKAALQWWYAFVRVTQISRFEMSKNITNGLVEFTLTHDQRLHANPFVDIAVEAVFTNKKTGEKTRIQGYYFDHNTWKLRFRPRKDAKYSWQLVARSARGRTTWQGQDSLVADAFPRITVDGNAFALQGQAFFSIGIQDAFLDRNYDGRMGDQIPLSHAADPLRDPENRGYLPLSDHLELFKKESGINLYRYGVDNWAPQLYQSLEPSNTRWDVYGGHFGDTLVNKLRDQNIHTIMTLFGFYPPFDSKEEIIMPANQKAVARYLNYVIARYAADIDLWEIGNEARSDESWYQFVLGYLEKNDPYHRPVSTNWEETSLEKTDFASIHWYNQNTPEPAMLSDAVNFIDTSFSQLNQPLLISELGFKNASWFPQSDQAVRILSWLMTFENMGIIFWNQGQNSVYTNPNNANVYLGPKERATLLTLSRFLPSMSLPLKTESVALSESQVRISFLKNKDYLLGYVLKISSANTSLAPLPLVLDRIADFVWIDPATGAEVGTGSLAAGSQTLVIPEFNIDLALKVTYR